MKQIIYTKEEEEERAVFDKIETIPGEEEQEGFFDKSINTTLSASEPSFDLDDIEEIDEYNFDNLSDVIDLTSIEGDIDLPDIEGDIDFESNPDDPIRNLSCELCKMKFSTGSNYNRHFRSNQHIQNEQALYEETFKTELFGPLTIFTKDLRSLPESAFHMNLFRIQNEPIINQQPVQKSPFDNDSEIDQQPIQKSPFDDVPLIDQELNYKILFTNNSKVDQQLVQKSPFDNVPISNQPPIYKSPFTNNSKVDQPPIYKSPFTNNSKVDQPPIYKSPFTNNSKVDQQLIQKSPFDNVVISNQPPIYKSPFTNNSKVDQPPIYKSPFTNNSKVDQQPIYKSHFNIDSEVYQQVIQENTFRIKTEKDANQIIKEIPDGLSKETDYLVKDKQVLEESPYEIKIENNQDGYKIVFETIKLEGVETIKQEGVEVNNSKKFQRIRSVPAIYQKLYRPYACPNCTKKFTTSSNLTRHMNLHLPQNVFFKCDNCPKTFKQKEYLKKHLICHERGTIPLPPTSQIV
ncbi:uncharacterized protein [Chironomus tepperi]|uniref:uncharacterized protein n=1 Tax=Chironomus tepperi TaxID=113505 RepID=UPI00391FBD5D